LCCEQRNPVTHGCQAPFWISANKPSRRFPSFRARTIEINDYTMTLFIIHVFPAFVKGMFQFVTSLFLSPVPLPPPS
ncbi:MAG: hypothetical protein IJH86_10835, partial [Clostridia bacterium]|nr:hypothetical protein [Clostridia bacterium]